MCLIKRKSKIKRKIIEKEERIKLDLIGKSLDQLIKIYQESNYIEWSYILGNKKEILKRNITAGIGRGIGIGIGLTLMTAVIVVILQKIVTLNIPIIGEFISDIVDIVENNR